MRSITFDTDGKLMGCGEDGQIYKKLSEDYEKSEWDGPINFDKPMKKIFFDKDLYLELVLMIINFIKREDFFGVKSYGIQII